MRILGVAGGIQLLLTVSKAISPQSFYFLPLGGSTIAELGIVLGVAVAVIVFLQAIRGQDVS